MRSKQLGGSRVWTAGSGPTVVVVHGGPGFNHKYLTRSLLPLSPHFRLVFYDQRSRGAISPAALTEQLRRILVAAAGDGPPVVLAHSWGTYLAFACLTLPDSPAVRGAVLVSPVPLTLNGFNRAGARFKRSLPSPAPTGIKELFPVLPREEQSREGVHPGSTVQRRCLWNGARRSAAIVVRLPEGVTVPAGGNAPGVRATRPPLEAVGLQRNIPKGLAHHRFGCRSLRVRGAAGGLPGPVPRGVRLIPKVKAMKNPHRRMGGGRNSFSQETCGNQRKILLPPILL